MWIRILPALSLSVLLAQAPPPARDAKADTVLKLHLKARGGVAKLKALKSLRISGQQLLLPAERGIPWRMEQARPNRFREEITVQGMVEVHTFNGAEGWTRIPWAPDLKLKPMTAEQISVLRESHFDDPWLEALEGPVQLQYQGTSFFNRVPVYVVSLRLGPGDELVGHFDQEFGLEIMRERVHRELGTERKVRTEFQEWRMVEGVAFPFEVTTRAMG
ncbi:MAG TPA: hypothetical protein VJ505_07265 [Holophagaceae bacterium]|nr:hypothetical protein [Geothrix sp.]HJW33150.1 hypothetical protein [Holophagaceae bacterium]